MNLHKSVLLKKAIDGLELQRGDVYLDATLGAGGHSEEVYKRLKEAVVIGGIDADESATALAKERLELLGAKPHFGVLNFRNIAKAPELLGIENPSKILFDLGWSSIQLEEGGRGLSFGKDEPLLMTLGKPDPDQVTAYEVVNLWGEESLADIIYGFGEEKFSRRIAKKIVERRAEKPIETSLELAEIIKEAVPIWYRFGRIHPATKTFQAIRIAVNDELNSLQMGLEQAFEILKADGRLAVISFHSLEDRIVKHFFKKLEEEGRAEIETKKPLSADEAELAENPRARSAKLRIIKKL